LADASGQLGSCRFERQRSKLGVRRPVSDFWPAHPIGKGAGGTSPDPGTGSSSNAQTIAPLDSITGFAALGCGEELRTRHLQDSERFVIARAKLTASSV